jgi:hypothetical protein
MSHYADEDQFNNPVSKDVAELVNKMSGGLSMLVLLIFWIPTTIVFLIDAQVLFALWQMFVGLLVGWRQQVGSIHDWLSFKQRFQKVRQGIGERLSATATEEWKEVHRHQNEIKREAALRKTFSSQQDSLQVSLLGGLQRGDSRDMDPPARCCCNNCWPCSRNRSTQAARAEKRRKSSSIAAGAEYLRKDKHVRLIWNRFIQELRIDDYISDAEMGLYMFLDNLETLYLNSEPLYLTPPVLTLEGVDRTLQYIDEERHKFRQEYRGIVNRPTVGVREYVFKIDFHTAFPHVFTAFRSA